jgi:MarR family transcriptional regulator, lower aerobic nicotinate degradation pathway regulator
MAAVNQVRVKRPPVAQATAEAPPFAGMPGHLIRRAQQIAVAIFMDACAEFDLTPVQYAALSAIVAHRGIDATRLAGLIALDKPTTGGVVDRLEAKGLVERTADATDRRVKRLTITTDGRRLLRRAEPVVAGSQVRILEPLTMNERATFLRLLHRLVDGNNAESRAPMRPLDIEK